MHSSALLLTPEILSSYLESETFKQEKIVKITEREGREKYGVLVNCELKLSLCAFWSKQL